MWNFRDAHFVIGEEDEKKTEDDDKVTYDPKWVSSFFYLYIWVFWSDKVANDFKCKYFL